MVHFTSILTTFVLTIAAVQAAPSLSARQLKPDDSGKKNIGNGVGLQFITGQCLSNADCASGCCATLPQGGTTIGICSGPAVGNAQGKQGCGFTGGGGGNGGNGGNSGNGGGRGGNPAPAPAAPTNVVVPVSPPGGLANIPSTLKPDVNGKDKVGNGQGLQFITGECTSDSDCASGCCAVVNTGSAFFGICSGPLANTQNGKQGCGFPAGGGVGSKAAF